jgi:membrane associated rhomboid family serine protease
VTDEQQPATPKKRFPTPVQAVVLTLAGFAMTFFGCLGAIASWDRSQILVGIALVATIAGVGGFAVGLISVLYLFVKGVVKAFKDSNRKSPPPPAGDPPASIDPPPAE